MKQEKKNIKVLEISSLLDYKSNAVNHGFTNHGRKENLILSFKRKPIAISIHQDRATSFILNDSIFIFYLKKITPLLFIICTLCYSPTFAQKAKKGKSTPTTLNRKNAVLIGPNTNIDSLRKAQIDSVGKKLVKEVPDSLKQSSDIKSTVVYSARDSTIMDTEKQVVYLYGDAKVDYGDIALTADYIQLNWKTNEVFAKGRRDSTKSKNIGMPVFKQGAESYNSDSIRYNFKSRKAIIKALVTQQGEGYVQGKSVKKDDEDNLYIRNAIYTTCNLKHPHFNIYASKLKIIGKKQIVSGPFNLEINDIPLPIGLPFGFFPYQQKKENGTSGILIGQYGEEPAQTGRGFYLRDFGYYLAVNEHIGVQFRSEIYTKGSWGLGANGQYNKKYRYSGSFSLAYNKNVRGDEINPIVSNDFKIQWSHSPISYGKTQFSASVNVATNSYNQYNNLQNPAAYISNTLGSSMSYSVTFSPQFRFGSSFRIDQNTSTRVLNTGLDLNFGMAQFQPFKNKKAVQEKFWDGFRFGLDLNTSISLTNQKSQFSSPYDFTITNVLPRDSVLKQQEELRRLGRISNTDVYDISLSTLPFLLGKANITTRFSVPLSLPNIKLGKYLNITPGISLQGDIYNRRLNYEYRGDNNPDQFVYKRADGTSDTLKNRTGVRIDTTYGAFIVYNYSLSASANTRLYGILPIRIGRLQAIRHTISPSISASYTPDFSQEKFGFFQQNVQVGVEKDGKPITRTLSRYNPGAYAGESGSLSFSLSNQFEAKLRSKSDTAAKEFEKLSLLDNFNVSASYNFLAKEYALSNISLSTSTRVSNFDISWNGNLDPYVYVEQSGFDIGQRVSRYRWQDGLGFAKLSAMNFSISRRFSPSKDKSGNTPGNQPQLGNGNPNLADTDANKAQLNQIKRTINDYIDWKVPWNLAINYNYSYSSPGLSKNPQIISSLTFNGDISISEKWRMTLSSGYDFKYNAFTYTNVSIVRDLHCWEILFNWIPVASPLYGRGSSYDFTIRAKSSLLQELKLTKRRSFFSTGGF